MSCCGGGADPVLLKRSMLEDHSPLGAYLSASDMSELANICQISRFAVGKPLPESPFYVMITGNAEVRDESGVLCTKYPKSFFTRRAGLISKQNRISQGQGSFSSKRLSKLPEDSRSSIVRAVSPTDDEPLEEVTTQIIGKMAGKVLWVNSETMISYLDKLEKESAEVINAITRNNIGSQLSHVPFIQQAGLEASALRSLGEICFYAHYPAGRVIFSQGDPAEYFYIILKGTVDVTIDVKKLRGSDDGEVKAISRGVGDSFGVAALVYNAPERKYTVTARDRVLCLVIAKPNFAKFLSHKPSLEDALMRTTKRFLLQRYAAMNVPIFAHLSEQMLETAASLARFSHFNAGDVVYKQGDPPSAFYVVLHGEVKMATVRVKDADRGTDSEDHHSRDEAKEIAAAVRSEQAAERVLTVGKHFGEVGMLLPQTPCIATCTALTHCTLLALGASAFLQLFGSDPNLLAEMQLKLLHNKASLKSCLNHAKCRPLFVKHIEGEYSGENVKFYDAVAEVVPKANALQEAGKGTEARAMITEVVKIYILDGADQQVNIPGPLQKKIKDLDADPISDWAAVVQAIRKAQDEIYVLMARDNYPRFTKSQPFQDLLDAIGSYDAAVSELVSDKDLTMLVQDGEGMDAATGQGTMATAQLTA